MLQGEYIAPEKIENVYQRSMLVAQAFVHGDSLKPQLVAVVVPDPDTLLPWAASRSLSKDLAALCKDAGVTAAVHKSMLEEGRAAGLKGFEQVGLEPVGLHCCCLHAAYEGGSCWPEGHEQVGPGACGDVFPAVCFEPACLQSSKRSGKLWPPGADSLALLCALHCNVHSCLHFGRPLTSRRYDALPCRWQPST